MASVAGQVARILYKEIVPGDRRKAGAKANNAKTGGGARDYRFGSYPSIAPAVAKMFPAQVVETRIRKKVKTPTTIYSGQFHWQGADGNTHSALSYFEPPTDARPAEGRLVRVSKQPCLANALMPPHQIGNRTFLLLIQLLDGTVWPFYAQEQTLRTPGLWDPQVAQRMLQGIDAKRPASRAVIGFFDFTNNDFYTNGR